MAKRRLFQTDLCEMLGIEYPILLAGMGGLAGAGACSKPELVAAVSNAGGMGVLGATGVPLDELRAQIREIKSLTDKPYGVDVLLPAAIRGAPPPELSIDEVKARYIPEEYLAAMEKLRAKFGIPEAKVDRRMPFDEEYAKSQVQLMLEEEVPLFASALGIPEWLVPMAHAGGMKVLGLAGNVRGAVRHHEAGADLIVAQGHEAGGHTGRIGTMALIPQVVDAVSPTPVLGAGGIGDGRGIVAALALGAAGVWVGTAFLLAREANVPGGHQEQMLEGDEEGTRISRFYSGKTLRMVKNPLAEAWDEMGQETLPMPLQRILVQELTQGMAAAGRLDLMCQPAGQIIGLCDEIKGAGEILDEMVAEVVEILDQGFPAKIRVG